VVTFALASNAAADEADEADENEADEDEDDAERDEGDAEGEDEEEPEPAPTPDPPERPAPACEPAALEEARDEVPASSAEGASVVAGGPASSLDTSEVPWLATGSSAEPV
jgi:hypothetical protein